MRRFLLALCTVAAIGAGAIYGLNELRSAAQGPFPRGQLKAVALGIHDFTKAHRELPTNLLDEVGRPILSWRVRICEYLDTPLSIDTSAAWDAAENRKLTAEIPECFRNENYVKRLYPYGCSTQILGVFAESGDWNGEGPANEFAVMVKGQHVRCVWFQQPFSVPWTQPFDISAADLKRILERDQKIADPEDRRVQCVSLADGSVVEAPFKWVIY